MLNNRVEIKSESHKRQFELTEIWSYRYLLWMLVKRDLITQYKQTLLRPLWIFLQPIITSGVFTLVVDKVMPQNNAGVSTFLFIYLGQVYWSSFVALLSQSANALVINHNLFSKIYFPRLIPPLAGVLSKFVHFSIQLLIFLIIYIFFIEAYTQAHWSILFLIIYYVWMAAFAFGVGLLISVFSVKYRDLLMVLQFGLQLFMFLTPVIYSLSTATGILKTILMINPLTPVFELVRFAAFGEGVFTIFTIIYSLIFILSIFLISIMLYNHQSKIFVDIA